MRITSALRAEITRFYRLRESVCNADVRAEAGQMTRIYQSMLEFCEHCDGECQRKSGTDHHGAVGRQLWIGRDDYLRGVVCERCDGALDAMLNESPRRAKAKL